MLKKERSTAWEMKLMAEDKNAHLQQNLAQESDSKVTWMAKICFVIHLFVRLFLPNERNENQNVIE